MPAVRTRAPRRAASRAVENSVRRRGYARVAGADEAGRGSLAGPVVAAAVILDPDRRLPGLRDSKLLTPAQRERLYALIVTRATWAVAVAPVADVDRLNVHRASLDAIRRAVEALSPPGNYAIVDGFRVPGLDLPHEAILRGDRRCAAIAAASIVAKVTRDREMVRLHTLDGRYGFDQHKGYGTRLHLDAIARHGYSDAHRRTFTTAAGRATSAVVC
ncbi:MAG: ribonuclease HII [Acidobacteria bacterium]|nr:ribonuclease HII [Acidobacteriota bacterium]MXZ71692.1 ribonuclease HII [Acidobacteriota bacterium]MYJ04918.1 ribonuclease HII [Acidobacteriota bacterium]